MSIWRSEHNCLKRISCAAWHGVPASISSRRLLLETDGQDLIEYALLTTFIGFAGAAAWTAMQTGLGNAYSGFNDARVESLGAGRSGGRRLVSVIAIAVVRRIRARGRRLLVRRAHAAHPQLADVPGGRARPCCCHGRPRRPWHRLERRGLSRRPGAVLSALRSQGSWRGRREADGRARRLAWHVRWFSVSRSTRRSRAECSRSR